MGNTPRETGTRPHVLVAEDEVELAALYETWLQPDYNVTTAHDGQEALDVLDETVNVVLLDRRMPELTGDEVVETIAERDYTCRVAMVTAVVPDFDILELGFDDYLTKPITKPELRETVERLLARATYDEQLREYFALVSKKAALDAEKHPDELAANDDYSDLERRIQTLRNDLQATLTSFDHEDFNALLQTPRPLAQPGD